MIFVLNKRKSYHFTFKCQGNCIFTEYSERNFDYISLLNLSLTLTFLINKLYKLFEKRPHIRLEISLI